MKATSGVRPTQFNTLTIADNTVYIQLKPRLSVINAHNITFAKEFLEDIFHLKMHPVNNFCSRALAECLIGWKEDEAIKLD